MVGLLEPREGQPLIPTRLSYTEMSLVEKIPTHPPIKNSFKSNCRSAVQIIRNPPDNH